MNELKLKEYNSKYLIYMYFPEGEGEPGEIVYDMESKEIVVVTRASNDKTGYYGRKASCKIEEFIEKNGLPIKYCQAWN